MTSGYVYILAETHDGHERTGLYKIGKTTQVSSEKRRRQYQAGNARPLLFIYEEWVEHCQNVETQLHRYWKNRGKHYSFPGGGDEWFYLSPYDVEETIDILRQFGIVKTTVNNEAKENYYYYQPANDSFFDFLDSGCLGYILVGITILFVIALSANGGKQNLRSTSGSNSESIENTTIGNSYTVKCRPGFTQVNIRKQPSLNAPYYEKALECGRDTVVLTGKRILTDDYWYPVETNDGRRGFIAKPAIDP